MHDNVTFEANTAGSFGGAVSLPFDTVLPLPIVVFCGRFCLGWIHSMRQLTKPRQKGSLLSSSHVRHS